VGILPASFFIAQLQYRQLTERRSAAWLQCSFMHWVKIADKLLQVLVFDLYSGPGDWDGVLRDCSGELPMMRFFQELSIARKLVLINLVVVMAALCIAFLLFVIL